MAKGYSTLTVQEINAADPNLLGVQLGRICVTRDIPVRDIAEHFDVSRMTVYSWFRGRTAVSDKYASKVQKLIARLA